MTATSPDTLTHLGGLTSAHGKDLIQERRLCELNELVMPLQETLEKGLKEPSLPPVFILGPPRSGTTLISQLLASTGLFTIASNFVARFWQAPALGLAIQDALALCNPENVSNFCSRRGITDGWCEPSEFGYFWSRYFDLGQDTHFLGPIERARFDRDGLRRALASMEQVGGRRLVLKNNTWFTLNVDLLAEVFPECIFIICKREPFYIAQSIWRQRIDHMGDTKKWWSVRPTDYSELILTDPLSQVAGQTLSIYEGLQRSVQQARNVKIFSVDYKRLCNEPQQVVAGLLKYLQLYNEDINQRIGKLPISFAATDRIVVDEKIAEALSDCISKLTEKYLVRTEVHAEEL